MGRLSLIAGATALLALLPWANAADCLLSQPRRPGDPSGQDIANALTINNQIQSVCAGNWPPLNNLVSTWNHGFMIYNVSRTDISVDITANCANGMNNIISQCISGDSYWGGIWSLGGATFTISNSAFPNNPLLPQDPGGPPAATTSVVVVTTNGQTLSATFVPTTLSDYAALTTQTTVTTTGNNGAPTPLVIWPGGIIWGILGAPPAVPIPPPVVPPPGVQGGNDNPATITSKPHRTTSTTSTTTTSSTSSDACYLYRDSGYIDPLEGDNPDDDIGEVKRSVAGRVLIDAFEDRNPKLKRARPGTKILNVGTCTLSGAYTAVTQPTYPGPGKIVKQEATPSLQNGALFQTAKWWFAPVSTNCAVPTYSKVGTQALQTMGINIGGNVQPFVNVDHVWELKLLSLFLQSRIGSNFDCNDFNTIFSVANTAIPSQSRLQTIFDQLPGDAYPDFAGMSATINSIKGEIFNPGGLANMKHATDNAKLNDLLSVGIAMDICHDNELKTLFDNSNNRMYQAFLGIDQAINNGCYKRSDGTSLPADWGSAYKQWMTTYLNDRSQEAWKWATSVVSALQASTNPTIKSGLQLFISSHYSQSNHFNLDFGLTWSGKTIQMRSLDGRDEACSLTTSTTITSPQTQSAVPIASPACRSNIVPGIPGGWHLPQAGNVDPTTLLYSMRQVICSNSCDVPAGVLKDTTVTTQNVDKTNCEIAIGVSSTVEAFMYRGSPSIDVEWQQCWDSTANIISTCVKDGPNLGWWNGDHVYQFYKAGFRPLNDPDAVHKVSITAWLPTSVPSGTIAKPTCEKDCRGFIPNPQWCNENCPCARKGSVC